MPSPRAARTVSERETSRGGNLHVSSSPVVNSSRILKQTLSVARSGLFSSVVICGMGRAGLPRQDNLSHGRRIDRVGGPVHGRRPSAAGRIITQLSWSRSVFRRYSQSDVRMVNAHSVAVLPVCYLMSRRLGAKLIYDTHELETEVRTATGVQRLIFKVIEQFLIKKCDAVFVVNQSIADWYQRRYRGVHPVAVRNISKVGDSERRIDLRGLLSVPADKRLFVFVGNFKRGRNIHAMLDAFADSAVNDHIVFIGGGGELDSLVSEYCAGHETSTTSRQFRRSRWCPTRPGATSGFALLSRAAFRISCPCLIRHLNTSRPACRSSSPTCPR